MLGTDGCTCDAGVPTRRPHGLCVTINSRSTPRGRRGSRFANVEREAWRDPVPRARGAAVTGRSLTGSSLVSRPSSEPQHPAPLAPCRVSGRVPRSPDTPVGCEGTPALLKCALGPCVCVLGRKPWALVFSEIQDQALLSYPGLSGVPWGGHWPSSAQASALQGSIPGPSVVNSAKEPQEEEEHRSRFRVLLRRSRRDS